MVEIDDRPIFEIDDYVAQRSTSGLRAVDPNYGRAALPDDSTLCDPALASERPDFVLSFMPATAVFRFDADRKVLRHEWRVDFAAARLGQEGAGCSEDDGEERARANSQRASQPSRAKRNRSPSILR
jgi:hypothetical protein